MPGDDQEAVTRQDLTEFRTFLLEQLKSHTSQLSSKFEKASTDAESALSVSKQLKVESEFKCTYPGNERNYKFNLEILDHLDSVSKARSRFCGSVPMFVRFCQTHQGKQQKYPNC